MIDFNNGSYLKLKMVNVNDGLNMVGPLLIENEGAVASYKSIRDMVIFTNKRIIAVNVQGVTGKKKDFTSLPYSKIPVLFAYF